MCLHAWPLTMTADAAERRLEAAATRAERAGDIESFIGLVHRRYLRAQETGRPGDTAVLVAEARECADRLRKRFRSRGGRLWAAQQLDETLADFLADELADGPLDRATFAHVESLKARTLLDALHEPAQGGNGMPRLGTELQELEAALMRFATPGAYENDVRWSELRLASLLPIGGPGDAGERRVVLARLEDAYAALCIAPPAVAPIAPLGRVQRALVPDEAIVEYVVARRVGYPLPDVWALVITRSAARVTRVMAAEALGMPGFAGSISTDSRAPIDFTPLGEFGRRCARRRSAWGRRARGRAPRGHRPRPRAPTPEQGLISPKHRRLVVAPHRMLHYVPYAALPDLDGRPLIGTFAITLVPSATVWEHLQARERPPVSRLVGIANARAVVHETRPARGERARAGGSLPAVAHSVWRRALVLTPPSASFERTLRARASSTWRLTGIFRRTTRSTCNACCSPQTKSTTDHSTPMKCAYSTCTAHVRWSSASVTVACTGSARGRAVRSRARRPHRRRRERRRHPVADRGRRRPPVRDGPLSRSPRRGTGRGAPADSMAIS